MTANDLVMWALLLFGLWLILIEVKMWLAPDRKGRVVAIEDQYSQALKDCNCGTMSKGRSHVKAQVRLEDGDLIDVDLSPCLLCMDKVQVGSQLGVTRFGKRLIGRRYVDLLGRGLANDDVPLPRPEEMEARATTGVTE